MLQSLKTPSACAGSVSQSRSFLRLSHILRRRVDGFPPKGLKFAVTGEFSSLVSGRRDSQIKAALFAPERPQVELSYESEYAAAVDAVRLASRLCEVSILCSKSHIQLSLTNSLLPPLKILLITPYAGSTSTTTQ